MAAKTPNLHTGCTARPDFPIKVRDMWPGVQQIQMEDGVAQSWYTRSNKWREFTLVFDNQTDAQIDDLIAFFDARKGPYEKFYYDLIQTGEDDIPVKLPPKAKLNFSFETAVNRKVTIKLREVSDS